MIGLSVKRKFLRLLYDYIRISTRVCKIYMLINCEHGVKDTDKAIFEKLKKEKIKI